MIIGQCGRRQEIRRPRFLCERMSPCMSCAANKLRAMCYTAVAASQTRRAASPDQATQASRV